MAPSVGYEKRSTPKAQLSPSLSDIAWAAGIYEGEGYCGNAGPAIQVIISQKDPELLQKMQLLFGGNLRHQTSSNRNIWHWQINGSRARGFVFTIFSFLTKRRREQIKTALLRAASFTPSVKKD